MQLNTSKSGKRYKIQDMSLALEIERRIETLGMTCGTVVTIMNRQCHGAVIIKVRGSRFAVGRNIAKHIQVNEEANNE
ncbi:MAG: FeoA domain-containing protein [Lachnospiraceae bacterium]|nr:FeoA domain-containing protein [Lachnospiraceae bacterium]